jgi:uncharacterized protein with PIN domain
MQYEAAPEIGSTDFETTGGAFVNCWIKADSESEAQQVAGALISEIGWSIVAVKDECREVTERSYVDNEIGREHYTQALNDGQCYVFDQWPAEPQEGDDVH